MKQTVDLRSEPSSRCLGIRVIKVVAYVYSLNARLNPKDWYIALETIIAMDKDGWVKEIRKAFFTQPTFIYLYSFDLEGKDL